MKSISTLLTLLLLAGILHAETYYIAPHGSDEASGARSRQTAKHVRRGTPEASSRRHARAA